MKPHHFIIVFCLLLAACSVPPKYIGNKFTPTQHVDVYHSDITIKKNYTVIGHLKSNRYPVPVVEKNLIRSAKEIGADAIIIRGDDAEVLRYD